MPNNQQNKIGLMPETNLTSGENTSLEKASCNCCLLPCPEETWNLYYGSLLTMETHLTGSVAKAD